MNIEKLSIKQIKDLMVKECNDELLTAIKKYSMLYLNSPGKIDSRRPR